MSRSLHVTKRQRQKDRFLNRDDSGVMSEQLSKLDELSLKKIAVKETEVWKRDAKKIAGLSHVKFVFTEAGWKLRKQKTRGVVSDVPGEVIAPKKKPN
jgi:hypothetical protein